MNPVSLLPHLVYCLSNKSLKKNTINVQQRTYGNFLNNTHV